MAPARLVTHAYRLDGGWQKVPRRRLTASYAAELREQRFTMVRAKRGLFDVREISILAQQSTGESSDAAGGHHRW